MCLRSLFCRWLCKYHKPKLEYVQGTSALSIYGILQRAYPMAAIYIRDQKYNTTGVDELSNILELDFTDRYPTIPERFDCDDYSFVLMGAISKLGQGLSFGILWTGTEQTVAHALNIFVDDNEEIWLIEPSTDEIFKNPDGWKPYLIII